MDSTCGTETVARVTVTFRCRVPRLSPSTTVRDAIRRRGRGHGHGHDVRRWPSRAEVRDAGPASLPLQQALRPAASALGGGEGLASPPRASRPRAISWIFASLIIAWSESSAIGPRSSDMTVQRRGWMTCGLRFSIPRTIASPATRGVRRLRSGRGRRSLTASRSGFCRHHGAESRRAGTGAGGHLPFRAAVVRRRTQPGR